VRVDVGLTFRIDPGDDPVSHRRPYPYREEAVRRAAYAGGLGTSGKFSSWADAPLGRVIGALAGLVSEHTLDELMVAENPRDSHHLLTEAVMRKVWDSLPKDGIKPLRMRIGRLSPPPEVTQLYTELWLTNRLKEDALARANGAAPLVREAETARMAAEITMLQAIVEGVRNAQHESNTDLSSYLVAVRMLEALQQMVRQSNESLLSAGGDTVELISEIHSVGERLSDLETRLKLPPPKFNPSRNE
jgi:hypothetical protein